jgi:hypothetical protein
MINRTEAFLKVQTVKAFTLPELLISLMLSLTVIYLCLCGFEQLQKRNSKTDLKGSSELNQVKLLSYLKADLFKSGSILIRGNTFIISSYCDTITYSCNNDTLIRRCKGLQESAVFAGLRLSSETSSDSSVQAVTLSNTDPDMQIRSYTFSTHLQL